MADSVVSYAITAGIFAFLTGILFGSRARRYRQGFKAAALPSESGET